MNPLSNEGSKEEKTVIRRSKFCHVEKRADSDFEILEESEDSEYEDSRKSSKRKKKSGGWKKSRIDLNDLVDDGDDLKYRSRLENVRKAKLERRYHRIQNDLDDVEDSDSEQTEVSDGYRVPNKVWANLHKYQRTGVRWLLELHRQAVGEFSSFV